MKCVLFSRYITLAKNKPTIISFIHSFKVCFHQRDFIPGNEVTENILEAVYTSKRVLCLVTSHFIESRYCLEEFNMAQTRNVQLKHRRLIVLKHDEFSIDAVVSHEQSSQLRTLQEDAASVNLNLVALRDFVARHTYISLDEKSWKDKLLYTMPIHRLGDIGDEPIVVREKRGEAF